MKKKIFLTGERGIGKSTCIDRALEGMTCSLGGFRTRFNGERNTLLMWDADMKNSRVAALFKADGRIPMTETFNGFGCELLCASPMPELLLMDELGRLERDALAFQCAVMDALDGETPVLGVIRMDAHGWLDEVREHENVEILTVTEKNRDILPAELKEKLALLGLR